MVAAKESQMFQQFAARKPSNLDHIALLQLEQNYSLPCFPRATFTASAAFPGQLRDLDTVQQGAVFGSLKPIAPHRNVSNSVGYPYPKDSQCALPHMLRGTNKPIDARASQKRFLIFDQSGNHTRLFFSPSFSPENQISAKIPDTGNVLYERVNAQVDQQFMLEPKVEEKLKENDLDDEDGEMLEDSEEINALLYSDSDDDGTDGENDEVTSTLHTSFNIKEDYNKENSLEDLTEQVASSDDSPKRQRLLDGSYKKSSLVSFESPVNQGVASSRNYEDDVESSCGGARLYYDDDTDLSKREKKVKIRDALKLLETIIPGLKSKDPFSIIDNAIMYLKSMKIEAEALGLGHPESDPTPLS